MSWTAKAVLGGLLLSCVGSLAWAVTQDVKRIRAEEAADASRKAGEKSEAKATKAEDMAEHVETTRPPSPCLSAETWVSAALRTPTTEWRGVVDAVGINEIVNWQLIVQVNSAWLSTPRGVRLQFIAEIDELVEAHSPKCHAVYWNRRQSRVAARGFDGEIELLTE